jgi:hypothetical protein
MIVRYAPRLLYVALRVGARTGVVSTRRYALGNIGAGEIWDKKVEHATANLTRGMPAASPFRASSADLITKRWAARNIPWSHQRRLEVFS